MFTAQLALANYNLQEANRLQAERKNAFREIHIENLILRLSSDPFSLPESRFINLFRLSKYIVQYLIYELKPRMKISSRFNAIPPELRIFASLIFYGTRTYQRVTGQFYLTCMSQPAISRSIHEVTTLINLHLVSEFIKFPKSRNGRQRISNSFERVVGFPGLIGSVDCTFVTMISPRNEEHNYVNRHNQHAKNVQIVSLKCVYF